MNEEILILMLTAASIGFFHTLFGPDHYLPFIVMAKARQWSVTRTAIITLLCGIGHIASSVILGIAGIAFGIGVMKLEALEAFRGNIAAWALIGFGFAYFIWGMHRAIKNKPHAHPHIHQDMTVHMHAHSHADEHAHVHESTEKKNITPWILFTIFVLGPCEPLIPLLMYPAAKMNMIGLIAVTLTFGSITVATMLSIVMLSYKGIRLVQLGWAERFTHALAGGIICASGLAIQFLGL